jgi:hypothetical protein
VTDEALFEAPYLDATYRAETLDWVRERLSTRWPDLDALVRAAFAGVHGGPDDRRRGREAWAHLRPTFINITVTVAHEPPHTWRRYLEIWSATDEQRAYGQAAKSVDVGSPARLPVPPAAGDAVELDVTRLCDRVLRDDL